MNNTIWSNDKERILSSGNICYKEDSVVRKNGSSFFRNGERFGFSNGNTTFVAGGTVRVSGNVVFTPKGEYRLNGNVLFGPNGKFWRGVSSIDKARDIAVMDQ